MKSGSGTGGVGWFRKNAKIMGMHGFLDTHDGFHFLIGFWSILQNVMKSVVPPMKCCISVLPELSQMPSSTMESSGPKLRKKNTFPGGLIMARTKR